MQITAESKPASYAVFRGLPENERWEWYEHAKKIRRAQEAVGCEPAETYDQFVKRVTDELEI